MVYECLIRKKTKYYTMKAHVEHLLSDVIRSDCLGFKPIYSTSKQ
jgi:hypothetical protein